MADGGAAVVETDRSFSDILLDELHPSSSQPRRSLVAIRDQPEQLAAYVRHIADTIEADEAGDPLGQGVREPLRVRRRPDGGFEIVDGECRYHAARLRGLRRLTCEIVVLTDEHVVEEQLIANGARLDLTPLEEADAFAALRELKLTPETIAERLGRTVRHVRKRLALVDHLAADGRKLLAGDEITIGLAEQLAALPVEAQARAVEDLRRNLGSGEPLASRDARWAIDRARLRLKEGGFPLDDATLVPAAGTCTGCPKRSGTQIALFLDGLGDQDLCSDEVCFKGKRLARLAQLVVRAKEQGLRVVDAPAEVKKLFPYNSSLAHDSPFVDLDTACDLVRPPSVETKSQGRTGGAAVCAGNGDGDPPENGKHDFARGDEWTAADYDDGASVGDEGTPGCREAAAAGCAAWVTCDHGCGAWQELDAQPGAPPPGWKPPTWREVLGQALLKTGGPTADGAPPTVKPDIVAADQTTRAHELVDKRQAVRLLQQAELVDKREAERETRNVAPPKKPGALDKWEIERKANHLAAEDATVAIVAKAVKKSADIRFWRFLAGLVLHASVTSVEGAVKRRGIEIDAKGRKHMNSEEPEEKALLGWIAEQKEDGILRGLVVELLVGDAYGTEDAAGEVACRFYGVDLAALQKEAATQVKAAAKKAASAAAEKKKAGSAKKKAGSAKKKAGSAKKKAGSAKKKAGSAKKKAPAPASPTTTSSRATSPSRGTCLGCGCSDLDACEGGCSWVDASETFCSTCASFADALVEHVEGKPAGVHVQEVVGWADEAFGSAEWYTGARRGGVLDLLVARGRLLCEADPENRTGTDLGTIYKAPPLAPAVAVAPEATGATATVPRKFSKAQVRDVEESCAAYLAGRSMTEQKLLDAIAFADEHAETMPVLQELVVAGKLLCVVEGDVRTYSLPPTRSVEPELPAATTSVAAPAERTEEQVAVRSETVQLAGGARKAAEARACPKCSAKVGKVCTDRGGKLGAGWFHIERTVADLALIVLFLRARAVENPGPIGEVLVQVAGKIEDTPNLDRASAAKLIYDAAKAAAGKSPAQRDALLATADAVVDGEHQAKAAKHLPPAKAPPTASTVRSCRCCGCTDAAACVDGDGAGECEWTELDLCSVCARAEAQALELCRSPQARSALVKALTSAKGKVKGKRIETWDKPRAERAIADLVLRGGLTDRAGKLLASPG